MSGTSLHATAVAYARRGWAVFPCRSGAKVPLARHGCRSATTDLDVVDAWWRQWPTANIGIATGRPSGLLLVDVDEYKPGAVEEWERLVDELGPLPSTLEARTPSGGRHLLFTDPQVRHRAALAAAVDIKAEGGYFIAAPSRVGSRRYEWASRLPPVELPQAWIHAVTRPPPPARPAPTMAGRGRGNRVGDDFNRRADWMADILGPAGWTYSETRGGRHHVRHPHARSPVSATISPDGEVLYVFTTSTVLEADRAYDRWGAFVVLHHGGDFRAAARALAERGWGRATA